MLSSVPLVSAYSISRLQDISISYRPHSSLDIKPNRILTESGPNFVGIASWYSESDPGINIHTANGEVFDDSKITCASWDFPFGTYLKVTNFENGRSVVCRVNDRGPHERLKRLIDLSKASFEKIGNLQMAIGKINSRGTKSKSIFL